MKYEIIKHIIITITSSSIMQTQPYPNTVTLITLLAALVGYSASFIHYISALLIIPILLLPRYVPIIGSHGWLTVAHFTSTTFAFGLISGYCSHDIIQYINSANSQYVPTMQIYLCFLTIYHYFEFQMVNNFHHSSLCWQSFLLYHSRPYLLANCFMYTEHIITKYVFAFSYKDSHFLIPLGIILVAVGESLRIAAFFTCRHNFTHLVRYRKVSGHELVTNGVYSIFRHPSYTGYFYFSIGGQILLGNIVSFFSFAYVLSKFFRERIFQEQNALVRFFPQYVQYRKDTYILIPFVKDPSIVSLPYDYEE